MAWETVTGYCWPQSVEPGGSVALHLSSAGNRPVAVEVARIGAQRTLVFADAAVEASEHPTPVDAASNGCAWPAALTITVDASWRSGYYEVVLEIDVDGKRRRSHAFFVVRPKVGAPGADPARAVDQHVARLQRLRWLEPVHGRDDRVAATTDGSGLSLQATGRGPAGDHDEPTRSADGDARRIRAAQSPLAVRRIGGVARLGAAVRRVGRARGIRVRRGDERRPRRPSRPVVGLPIDVVGRPRRVLVGTDARQRRALHRRGRQRRVLLGQHVVLAGTPRRRDPGRSGPFDGRLQGPVQGRSVLRHRSGSAT